MLEVQSGESQQVSYYMSEVQSGNSHVWALFCIKRFWFAICFHLYSVKSLSPVIVSWQKMEKCMSFIKRMQLSA